MSFEIYKERKTAFFDLLKIEDWEIKVYTITNRNGFKSIKILDTAIKALPNFLQIPKASELPVYKVAFLIVHEAREGVWILFNWWTGGEMLETTLHFTDFNIPDVVDKSPHDGALACVWDLEVILHERKAWIEHILKKADEPAFNDYLNDYYIQKF